MRTDAHATLWNMTAFVARFATSAGLIALANWMFDYPFTGWAIWRFGPFYGGAFVIALAPVVNYGIVRWYRATTSDWFGMEWLRAQEAMNSRGLSGRFIRTCLKKSRLLAFASISALLDPTYAFIYQRGRLTGTRFTKSDWWWFASANVIGILPWVIGISVFIETMKRVVA